ncbi:MAG: SAM-dependent methyltransferase [Belnapia sp.]|nr:SAM-dependent methyltransferase [Belnapia sp.]
MTHMPIQATCPVGLPQASALPDPRVLLDDTLARLRAAEPVAPVIEALAEGLRWLRGTAAPAAWQRSIAAVRKHPLLAVLHQNPLARRCFHKPRGFAGDAPMLDMLYLGEPALANEPTTPLGLALFRRDLASASAAAARARIGLMAARIDAAAEARRSPHVLALGCGHLREAGLSRAVQEGRIGRFVALDQDAASLAVVQVEQAAHGIETLHRSSKATFDGTLPRGGFDLIYAVALYDDLTDRLAHTITAACFALLRPGGRLLVANTDRALGEAGYLEACHDWVRFQRDAAGMLRLAHGIPSAETALCHLLPGAGPEQHVLEIVRRGGAA